MKSLAELTFEGSGFELVSLSSVNNLRRIDPSGQVNFRQSLINGNEILIKLINFIHSYDDEDNWNFNHIIITDGQDTDTMGTLNIIFMIFQRIKVP